MERKFGVDVRKEVDRVLAETWPQFESVPVTGVMKTVGWRLFRWKADANLWFFLVLIIDRKFNKFAFELGWNDVDEYPDFHAHCWAPEDPSLRPRCRYQFMVPEGLGFVGKDWKVGSNPLFIPQVVVPTAIAEMKAFFEPVIKNVLDRHGKNAPTTDASSSTT